MRTLRLEATTATPPVNQVSLSMVSRGIRLVLLAAVFGAALFGAATAAASGSAISPVPTVAPIESEAGHLVPYGRSRLLVVQPSWSEEGGGITRVNLDGAVDPSFGEHGTVKIASEDAAVSAGGKILVATTSHPRGGYGKPTKARITRLLPDGQLDPSFGVNGHVDIYVGRRYDYADAVAVTPNGDILVAGTMVEYASDYGNENRLAVARLKPDGSPDRSFGKRGFELLRSWGEIGGTDIAPTPSGGILVQGGNEIESFLWKLKPNGAVDRRFGDGGYREVRGGPKQGKYHQSLLPVPGFVMLASGKVLLAATGFGGKTGTFRSLVVRLQADGRVDRSFGRDGWVNPGGSSLSGFSPLPGGDIAVATSFHGKTPRGSQFGVVALTPDGRLDKRFGRAGRCRAHIGGRPLPADVVVLGDQVIVGAEGTPESWLLRCPLPDGHERVQRPSSKADSDDGSRRRRPRGRSGWQPATPEDASEVCPSGVWSKSDSSNPQRPAT